jgi:hypothetical protein
MEQRGLSRGIAFQGGRAVPVDRFVVPPPVPAVLSVTGSDELFPVRRVTAIGKNTRRISE